MTQVYRYCFTVFGAEGRDLEETTVQEQFKKALDRDCKKWCFQLERGEETGSLHFQGRIALKIKQRKKALIKLILPEWNICWSVEQNESASSLYVTKAETRVAGPWSDRDKAKYIPRQLRGLQLQGWQLALKDSVGTFDTRKIHFVIDSTGGIGKSTFVSYMALHHNAILIPNTCTSSDDMMQYAASLTGDRKEDLVYMLDIPRSVEDKSWGKWLSAIESMKNGHLYDHRYKATELWVDSPGIVVFANELPPSKHFTGDRWVIMRPGRFDAGAGDEIVYGREDVIEIE